MNKDEVEVAALGIIAAAITLCWLGWCALSCGASPNERDQLEQIGAARAKADLYDQEHPQVKK